MAADKEKDHEKESGGMAWGFPNYVEIALKRPSFRTYQVGETIH